MYGGDVQSRGSYVSRCFPPQINRRTLLNIWTRVRLWATALMLTTTNWSSPLAYVKGKSKVFPYSLPSAGPGADPGVQAVSPQVTWSESRHRPGSRLPLLSAGPAVNSVAFTRCLLLCVHFGIENLVANRQNRFIKRYGDTDNYSCQMLCRFVSFFWLYFFIAWCLISVCCIYSFILCYHVIWWNKAVYTQSPMHRTPWNIPTRL